MNKKLAKKLVELIFNELNGRGGFDHWWGNIDDDIQDEIKGAVVDIIVSF